MLLPALNKAREHAKKVSCLSNLKQIGQTFATYQSDYDDYLPLYYDGASYGTQGNWFVILGYYYFKDKVIMTPIFNRWAEVKQRIFACPGRNETGLNAYYRCDYSPSQALIITSPSTWGGSAGNKIVSIKKILSPSGKVILAESTNYQYFIGAWMIQPADLFDARHDQGANMLYVDGHVGWMKAVEAAKNKSTLFGNYYK